MSDKNDGGNAFPAYQDLGWEQGMSLRDWFAGMALNSLMIEPCEDEIVVAEYVYKLADAMLEERKK